MATTASTFAPNPVDMVPLELDQIQGNILAGFNKDHQRFLFLHIVDAAMAKRWLATMIEDIAMTDKVKSFNDGFKLAKAKVGGHEDETMPVATWRNIAFNYPGLEKLGASDLHHFPDDFKEGMAARSHVLGDVGRNAPEQWDPWLQKRELLHIILLLAADRPEDLAAELAKVMATLPMSGLRLVHTQAGEAPTDVPANEHFGFRDGISQPGVKGFTLSVKPPVAKTGHQGVPGQDLLWPGEFVLGYATQNRQRPTDFDGPNPAPVFAALNGPGWARNGSFLVFRKLQQDVAGFRNSIRNNATMLKVDPELLGAKIVGRFRSGCPMEHTKDELASVDPNKGDPSVADPTLLSPDKINNFEYGEDLDGGFLPRSGHVRKAYPRDEQPLLPNGTEDMHQDHLHESNTQTHRVLRRGIPFGPILPFPAPDPVAGTKGGLDSTFVDDQEMRGLLFLAYQHSIAQQFEFIQSQWVNKHDFPDFGDGVDPVMAQVTQAPMQCPFQGQAAPTTFELKHFVTTNGGEYFFQPSLDALRELAT